MTVPLSVRIAQADLARRHRGTVAHVQMISLAEHQPREHPVPCQGCGAETWAIDALCPWCAADAAQAALDIQTTENEAAQ